MRGSLLMVVVVVVACTVGTTAVLRAQQARPPQGAGARERAEALRSSDATKRAAAAFELSKRPEEARAAMSALVELIGDATVVDPNIYRKQERWWSGQPDFTVGKEAARALTAAGGEAVAPLIAALGRAETEARRNAAWALGAIGDGRAEDALRAALRDEDKSVREQARWALGVVAERDGNVRVRGKRR